jgi:hypothetical protein
MREINKIAEGLFEKIRDRFEDVSLGDDKAKATQDPEKARFFNFDYIVDGHNHGNITLSLIDETSLKVYFSKNISHDLDSEHKQEWYAFLRELRRFAKENLLSFEPRDITRSTLKHRDIQQQSKADSTYSKDEVVSESLSGTRKSSYERKGPVRIIVRHSKPIEDAENHRARTHHINSIYLETQEGERFKLPVKSLRLGRALAQHLKHGGSMQDDLGRHICEMAVECAKLKPFINNTRHRVFEDEETQAMAEAAFEYHGLLNNTLKRMTGKKGYKKCAEQFVATSTSFIPEVDADEMKQRFEKRTFDDRLEEALPLVHKAYNMKKENKFAEQFVNWANTIAEGTWAFPDSDDEVAKLIDVLSNPLPAGVDGQNATNILYNILGDDRLFDQIAEIAKVDPEEDVRSVVENWLQEHAPHIYQQIQAEIGDPDVPEPFEQGQEDEVDEGNTYGSGDGGMDGVVYEDEEECKYCGGDCPHDEEHACDGYLGDIDDLYKVKEERDIDDNEQVCVYCGDPRDDKLGCCDENHFVTKKEFDQDNVNENEEDDSVEAIQSAIIRRIINGKHYELLMKLGPAGVSEVVADLAYRVAPVDEIGSSDISAWVRELERDAGIEQEHSDLHEAFEQAMNEAAINIGDIIRDKTQPEISGKVVGDMEENYTIQVDGELYHIKKLNAEKINGLNEAVDLNQLKGQEVYVPGEGTTGVVAGIADPTKFSNSVIVNLKNGRQTVAHFKDVQATKPGLGKQLLDKLNAWTGGGTMPKRQPKPIGQVGDLNTPQEFKKLAGIK